MQPYLRLRQICLVAAELEPAVEAIADVFGLAVCYRDPHVAKYGLVNALFPIGASFLEVVAPTRPGTAAGRYLERRRGDGGYMVILDCDDWQRRREHLSALGIRVANHLAYETYTGLQLHPRDTGGAMLELNHTAGGAALDGPYHPAGPDWRRFVRRERSSALVGAELQSPDPERLAARWGAILERPVEAGAEGVPEIALDLGRLRFVAEADGRGEGLGGIDLAIVDRAAVLAAAQRRALPTADDVVTLCGTRFRLGPAP